MPNATVEDDDESESDETVYVIKVLRDEFDAAAERYLLEKFGAAATTKEATSEVTNDTN